MCINVLTDNHQGSIYSLSILGKRRVFVSSVALMNEICDEKRFGKIVTAALGEVRNLTGDGLFTAVCSDYQSFQHDLLTRIPSTMASTTGR
jgi:hypothetical protein